MHVHESHTNAAFARTPYLFCCSFDLERNGVKVGKAVLTGTATSVDKQTDKKTDKKTDSFELNSLMTIEVNQHTPSVDRGSAWVHAC
jgi:hypothetical protein